MNCPYCAKPMTAGTIHSRAGNPRDTCFRSADGEMTPLGKYTRSSALQCEDCGTIIIEGRFADSGGTEPKT